MNYRKEAKTYLKQRNAEIGSTFVEVSKHEYPPHPKPPIKVWRNNQFFVQAFIDNGFTRLSISRSAVKGFRKDDSPIWADGITWDELQSIKNSLGFTDRWAVEVFPPVDAVINVANLRHLWLLPEPPAFGWHKEGDRRSCGRKSRAD